jgi:hypothetical protein
VTEEMGWLAVEATLGNFLYRWQCSVDLTNKREERSRGCTVLLGLPWWASLLGLPHGLIGHYCGMKTSKNRCLHDKPQLISACEVAR